MWHLLHSGLESGPMLLLTCLQLYQMQCSLGQALGPYSSLSRPSWLTERGIKGILMHVDGVIRFMKAALITSSKCEQQQNLPLCLVKKLAEQVLHM